MNYQEWRNEAVSERLNYFYYYHNTYPIWINRRNEEFFIEWLLTIRKDITKIQIGKD